MSVASSGKSQKSWYFTWQEDSKDLFIWKNDARLKIPGESVSTGPVVSVEEGAEAQHIKIRGVKPHKWKIILPLSYFDGTKNNFCSQLVCCKNSALSFCSAIALSTKGEIEHITPVKSKILVDPSTSISDDDQTQLEPSPSVTVIEESQLSDHPENDFKDSGKKKKKTLDTDLVAPLNKEISENLIGTFEIPIHNLCDSTSVKIREVKDFQVDYLVDQLMAENQDFEELASPLLVIASVTKSEFKPGRLNSYTYSVIGGVHRYQALKIANEQGKGIISRRCAVYGNGLSRNALLRLANQHNEINRVQRTTTFAEVAASCRRLLFTHFGQPGMQDDGKAMPEIPHYNSHLYIKWKEECLSYLLSTTTSKAFIETAIQMAIQPSDVYHRMQKVFSLFEEGSLKGQTYTKKSGGNAFRKALQGKYCAKLNHFKMFQGLPNYDKLSVLKSLEETEISMPEAANRIKQLKAVRPVQDIFAKKVNAVSTEDAKEKYPQYWEKLAKFTGTKDLEKNTIFQEFCTEAMLDEIPEYSQVEPVYLTHNEEKVQLHVAQVNQIVASSVPKDQYHFVDIKCRMTWTAAQIIMIVTQTHEINRCKEYTIHIIGAERSVLESVCDKAKSLSYVQRTKLLAISVFADEDVRLGFAYSKPVLLLQIGQANMEVVEVFQEKIGDTYVNQPYVSTGEFDGYGTDWCGYLLLNLIPKKSTILAYNCDTAELITTATHVGCSVVGVLPSIDAQKIMTLVLDSSDQEDTQFQLSQLIKDASGKRPHDETLTDTELDTCSTLKKRKLQKRKDNERRGRTTRSSTKLPSWKKDIDPDTPLNH